MKNRRLSTGSKAAWEVSSSSKSLRGYEKGKTTADKSGVQGLLATKRTIGDTLETSLEERKDALLEEKQLQLQRIFDRHDDMVRVQILFQFH